MIPMNHAFEEEQSIGTKGICFSRNFDLVKSTQMFGWFRPVGNHSEYLEASFLIEVFENLDR